MSHREDVDAILKLLRSIAKSIPGYAAPPAGAMRRLVRTKSVPLAGVITAGIAVDAHERLARASEVQGPRLRKGVEYCNAYQDVAAELIVMLRGVQYALAKERADLGDQALRVLRMADELNRRDRDVLIIPHVRSMRDALKQRRRRKKRGTAEQETAPPQEEPGGET